MAQLTTNPIPFSPGGIPEYLKRISRWAPWQAAWNVKRGKFDKIPINLVSGHRLSTASPLLWWEFDKALSGVDRHKCAGLGFCMTDLKGVVAIDLDNCVGADWALALINMMGSYTELSPSGNGYRIFLCCQIDRDWTNHDVGIEVYGGHAARFLTVTGLRVDGTPPDLVDVSCETMDALAKQYAKGRKACEVIDLTMPELLDEIVLPTLDTLPIPDAPKRFLTEGEYDLDRSGSLFACGVALYAAGYSDQVVFSLLANNDHAMEVALDHRRQDYDRALQYLWREHCLKAKGKGSKAIAGLDEFDAVPMAEGEKPLPRFADRDKNGKIPATIRNVDLAVRDPNYCRMIVRYDIFHDEIMFAPVNDPKGWRSFRDCDYVELRLVLEGRGFKPIGRELIRDVVMKVADDNQFDTAIEWLSGLQWDGISRIDQFLPSYFGADDTPYTRAVSLYMWTAMAGRVMSPGIKADMVPILVGHQGTLKSSSIAAMVPGHEFFTEISFHEKDEDLARKMRGRLIGEIGELRGLHTRELESIKAFITRTHENWVPKYREFAVQFPRRLIFIGTTNQDQFLADDTGNRRWLPVRVTRADIEAVKRDRNQLWAEAAVMFELLGVAFQGAEALGQEAHAEHTIIEPWSEDIARWLDEPDLLTGEVPREREFLQASDVARECLRIDVKNYKKADQMQIGKILRVQGYVPGKPYLNGVQIRAWVKNRTTKAT